MGNRQDRRIDTERVAPFGRVNAVHNAPADAKQAIVQLHQRLQERKQLYAFAKLEPTMPTTLRDAVNALYHSTEGWQAHYTQVMHDLDALDATLSSPVLGDRDAASRVLALAAVTPESAVSRAMRGPLGESKVLRIIRDHVAPGFKWFGGIPDYYFVKATCVDAVTGDFYFVCHQNGTEAEPKIGIVHKDGNVSYATSDDPDFVRALGIGCNTTWAYIAAHRGVVCLAGYHLTDNAQIRVALLMRGQNGLTLWYTSFLVKADTDKDLSGLRQLLVDTSASPNPFRIVTRDGVWALKGANDPARVTPVFAIPHSGDDDEKEQSTPLFANAGALWAKLTLDHVVLFTLDGPPEDPVTEVLSFPIYDMHSADADEDNEHLISFRRPGAETDSFLVVIAQNAAVIETNGDAPQMHLLSLPEKPVVLYGASFVCGDHAGNIWTHNREFTWNLHFLKISGL